MKNMETPMPASGEPAESDIEQYRSYTAPGLDCPECGVDTGDSEHFISCTIGRYFGQNTRFPVLGFKNGVSRAQVEELEAQLKKISEAERRAHIEARDVIIG